MFYINVIYYTELLFTLLVTLFLFNLAIVVYRYCIDCYADMKFLYFCCIGFARRQCLNFRMIEMMAYENYYAYFKGE